MEQNALQLYESIFKRKSTRKYQPESLSPDQLSSITAFAAEMKPLHPQIRTKIELAGAVDVKGMVSAKTPHYLLLYSEKKEGYLQNAGFLLQQADLFLSSLGLGSCWLGMAKTTAPAKDGLAYVIMLAFGKAQGNPHRESLSEFSRRPLSEIAKSADERLEAVRLAPSATNSQPWYFVCEGERIFVYRKKLGVLKAAMSATMNRIEMGIALCHLWLADKHRGQAFSFSADVPGDAPEVDGYRCIGSVN